jgi:CheY-like chemotaxis protein
MDLRGNRIALVGFPVGLAENLAVVLKGAGCVLSELSMTSHDPGDPFASYDLFIVWADETGIALRAEELGATSQPWLLMGPEAPILQNSSLYLRAEDVIFHPCSPSELLFRISRTIQRMNIGTKPSPKRPAVLVADDDPAIRMLLQSVLRDDAWDCHFASDGRQALSMAHGLSPDVLVLDIEMPFMTGLEVLRRIRRDTATRAIKILLLTASTDLKRVEGGLLLGADDYLAKPFSQRALLNRVRNLLSAPSAASPAQRFEAQRLEAIKVLRMI